MNSQSHGVNNSCSCAARTTRSTRSCSERAFSPVRGREQQKLHGQAETGGLRLVRLRLADHAQRGARRVEVERQWPARASFPVPGRGAVPARPPRRGQSVPGWRTAAVPAARNVWRAKTKTPVPPAGSCPGRRAFWATSRWRENPGARARAFRNNPRAPATRAASPGRSAKVCRMSSRSLTVVLESDSSRRRSAKAP